jgi:hypothetical protein
MKKTILYMVLAMLCFFFKLSAQDNNYIRGRVTDSITNQLLKGATVKLQGSQFSTITDDKGYFSIATKDKHGILIISYVGYETAKVNFSENNAGPFNISLPGDHSALIRETMHLKKLVDKENPGMLVLANDPNTQNINSACYSIIINRLTKLINTKGNLPSALIVDEVPTLFVHRVENLIATARSNKVAVLMGLQELPQFNQQYGKDTAATITAVVGTVISGSVRNKDTLEWLERLFGKSKQMGESLSIDRNKTSTSLNEKLEALIPAGKIASLNSGEMVGVIAADAQEKFTGQFETSAVNCRINLDMDAIKREEKGYKPLPAFYDFGGKLDEKLRQNFDHISQEIQEMVLAFRPATPSVPVKATMKK